MQGQSYTGDMDKSPVVLTLTIDNSEPVALSSFVKAFTSLAAEYEKSVRESENFTGEDTEIYIKQIRAGSIVADLIPIIAPILPLVVTEADKIFVAIEFVEKWGDRLTKLMRGVVPEGSSKSDLKRWADAVENIARDPNASATLEVATFEDKKREIRASLKFNTKEARQIQATIEGEFRRLEEDKSADHERVLLVFTRSDIGDARVGKPSGERVVIEEISSRPLAITYGSELSEQRLKYEIRESYENIYKKGFSVDVKVQTRGGKPVAYSILNVHEVIDLPE